MAIMMPMAMMQAPATTLAMDTPMEVRASERASAWRPLRERSRANSAKMNAASPMGKTQSQVAMQASAICMPNDWGTPSFALDPSQPRHLVALLEIWRLGADRMLGSRGGLRSDSPEDDWGLLSQWVIGQLGRTRSVRSRYCTQAALAHRLAALPMAT